MLYFSELEGKRVFTEDRIEVGKLEDMIFMVSANPQVTKLVIHTPAGSSFMLPFRFVSKMNGGVIIKKAYLTAELEENELYLKKNLLDKQIIDIGGSKVVRVNDVSLQEKITSSSYELYITGVDIGALGILRRLKVESIIYAVLHNFRINLTSHFLSWADIQPLELTRGKVKLKKKEEKLENIRPEDLADYLEKTNEKNVRKFLSILDKNFANEVIGNLNINYQRDLFQHWDSDKAASIIGDMNPVEAVDILINISRRKREEILSHLAAGKRTELSHLLTYARTPIGKRLTSEFLSVLPTATVREVIRLIKKETADFSFFATIYVVNDKKQLIGVFNPHDLLMQEPDIPVYRFMIQNLIEVRANTPIEIVISKLLKYHLPCLPVVDDEKRMIGMVTFDSVADIIEKKCLNQT